MGGAARHKPSSVSPRHLANKMVRGWDHLSGRRIAAALVAVSDLARRHARPRHRRGIQTSILTLPQEGFTDASGSHRRSRGLRFKAKACGRCTLSLFHVVMQGKHRLCGPFPMAAYWAATVAVSDFPCRGGSDFPPPRS